LEHLHRYRSPLAGTPTDQRPGHRVGFFRGARFARLRNVRAGELIIGAQQFVTVTVEESASHDVEKPTTVANDEAKRWRGGRGPADKVEERVNWCYAEILRGGTRRQVTARLTERFGTSLRTADSDYSRALELLKVEQSATRSDLLNQIQALRLATVRKALAKGQLQTVAMLLKDMGAVIGEAAPEQQAAAAPTLNITVEDKRQG